MSEDKQISHKIKKKNKTKTLKKKKTIWDKYGNEFKNNVIDLRISNQLILSNE